MTAYGTWGYGYNYFSYSGDSLEIAGEHSSSPTVQFSWDTRSSLPLMLSDGTDDYIYGPLGVPIEQINVSQPQNNSGNGTDNPTYLYYSPTSTLTGFIVVNTAGMLDNGELYDSYGNNLIGTGPGTTFGYQGQYYGNAADTSGFYYMRARYYDPPTGQFTSMDPQYLSTYQAYSYANGNPISGGDPSGLNPNAIDLSMIARARTNYGSNCGGISLVSNSGSPTSYDQPKGNNPMQAMAALNGYLDIPFWQVAGIVGNLMEESVGVDPTKNENSYGAGRGIAQWGVHGRWQQLLSWVNSDASLNYGIFGPLSDPTGLAEQLGFVAYELKTDYSNALAALRASNSIDNATVVIMKDYEQPDVNVAHLDRREQDAQWVYWKWQQTYPTAGSGVFAQGFS
jgi:RHS repeat-associated protein